MTGVTSSHPLVGEVEVLQGQLHLNRLTSSKVKFNGMIHSNIVSALLGAVTSRSSGERCGDVKYTFTSIANTSFYRSSTLMELQNKYMIISIVYGEKKRKIVI